MKLAKLKARLHEYFRDLITSREFRDFLFTLFMLAWVGYTLLLVIVFYPAEHPSEWGRSRSTASQDR